MKRLLILCLCCLLLTACSSQADVETSTTASSIPETTAEPNIIPTTTITEPAETEGSQAKITIFSPDENFEDFVQTDVYSDEISADIILHELIHAVPLDHDIQVNAFSHEGNVLSLDLSAEFGEQLRSQGSTGERMIMGCVVNTYLLAYGADSISITVDGEVLESGHVVYDFPLEFFE